MLLALVVSECQSNHEQSLPARCECQGGVVSGWDRRAASESARLRARTRSVAPSESKGADTAATIAPLRVSARRTLNHVIGDGPSSRYVKVTKAAAGALPPFRRRRTVNPRSAS